MSGTDLEGRGSASSGSATAGDKVSDKASNKESSESVSRLGSILGRIRKTDSAESKDKSSSISPEPESKVLTARGTEDGLVLRIDGKAKWEIVLSELEQFLGSRRRFLDGGEVSIEWLERLPTPEQSYELEQYLRAGFGVDVVSRRKRPAFTTIVDRSAGRSSQRQKRGKRVEEDQKSASDAGLSTGSSESATAGNETETEFSPEIAAASVDSLEGSGFNESPGAMDHYLLDEAKGLEEEKGERVERVLRDTIEILEDSSSPSYLRRVSKILGEELVYEEDANAKIVFGTFRSGQRLETPYSLVVIGDVNPGADLVAGGDIFVLGSLKGTAHAAAYDDEAQDKVIVALHMQPVQLRIGSILSRGSDELGRGPEIARIENRRIIVEGFNPRTIIRKR